MASETVQPELLRTVRRPYEVLSAAELSRSLERLRLVAVSLALTLTVFSQSSGSTETDTKIDLVVSPLRFLKRAVVLWDPLQAAGQMQNQSYGYLFPIGPFYAVLHALRLPPWEMQRAWQSVLVVGGFLGMVRLARRLGVPRFWPPVVTGLAYILTPRVISELPYISSELMPVAALPWVLGSLVKVGNEGSAKRGAVRSGVGFLFAGGVNAAASVAILPVPALWLLTRRPGPRRRSLMTWWVIAIGLASLWWVGPLLLLGKYSPPFLDWIESASITTVSTSLLSTVRGVDHWESLLGPNIWPSGWIFATAPGPLLATTLVAIAGLCGLVLTRKDVRTFLFATLLLGLVLVTLGHISKVAPPFADELQRLLDGPLVPFRNVHKFDPIIRLPLAVGIGMLVARAPALLARTWPALDSGRIAVTRWLVPALVVAVGAVAIAPLLNNQVANNARVTAMPGWWTDAATWLGKHNNGSRALLMPSSSSTVYLWGPTVDTALQPIAHTPWTVRDAVPLTQAGYTRLLDEIDAIVADGRPTSTLAPLLRRAGIGWIVLANDLDTARSHTSPHIFTRSVLEGSAGISLSESFGPDIGTGTPSAIHVVDGGANRKVSSIQIFQIDDAPQLVALTPLANAISVNGSTDSLSTLIASGLDPRTPVLTGTDSAVLGPSAANVQSVLTEGIRRQEADFGSLNLKSPTMTADQPFGAERPVHDYLPDGSGPLSTYRYSGGITGVFASSDGAQLLAFANRGRGNGPWSAIDGDPSTAWYSGVPDGAAFQWLQVDFDKPHAFDSIELAFAKVDGPLPTKLLVQTDRGYVVDETLPFLGNQHLKAPSGEASWLRVSVVGVAQGGFGKSVGISELSIPGVTPRRTLVVPGSYDPGRILFAAPSGDRTDCIVASPGLSCDPDLGQSGEEDDAIDRTFSLRATKAFALSAQVRLKASDALSELVSSDVRVHASSFASDDPRVSAYSVIDGDASTSWQPAIGDPMPTVTLDFAKPRRVASVTVRTSKSTANSEPTQVRLTVGDVTWSGSMPDDGVITLPHPVTASSLTFVVEQAQLRDTTSSLTLKTQLLTVGLAEILIDGQPALAGKGLTFAAGCPGALAVSVDGVARRMRLTGNVTAALRGGPVTAELCDGPTVTMAAGSHDLRLASAAAMAPLVVSATAAPFPAPADASGLSVRTLKNTATHRTFLVTANVNSLLQTRENLNGGWKATYAGQPLKAIRIDGWQQGFVLPEGTFGVVDLTYAPQTPFDVALIAGLLAAILLIVMAVAMNRPDEWPPVSARELPWWAVGPVIGVAVFMLAGYKGVEVAVGVAAVLVVLRMVGVHLAWWIGPSLLAIGAVIQIHANEFARVDEANTTTVQLICIAAISMSVVAGFERHEIDE